MLVDRLVKNASDAAIEQLLLSFLVFLVRWYQYEVWLVADLTLRKVAFDLSNFLLQDGVVYGYVKKDETVAFLAIALLVELLELIEYVAHGEYEVCAVAELHLFAQGEFQGESINHIVCDNKELAKLYHARCAIDDLIISACRVWLSLLSVVQSIADLDGELQGLVLTLIESQVSFELLSE